MLSDIDIENIFQYISGPSSRRAPSRSRGLSDISNNSRGSTNAYNSVGFRASRDAKHSGVPRMQRQAPAPLNIPPPLRTDGFVRFLQQHASPPHHRVTAGGRIVPAGPTSPPPMLDYASLTGLAQDRTQNVENSQNRDHSRLSAFRSNDTRARVDSPANHYSNIPISSNGMNAQPGYPANSVQDGMLYDTDLYGYQPVMTPTTQVSTGVSVTGIFPDGSTLVLYNGLYQRMYWNGVIPVLEPLQPYQLPLEQISHRTPYPQSPYNVPLYNLQSTAPHLPSFSAPLTNISNGSRGSNSATSNSQSNRHESDAENELKSQLTELDQHLALWHYDITSRERANFVARRRYLVETLDKLRVSRDNARRPVPIIAPATGLPITPPQDHSSNNAPRSSGLSDGNLHDQGHGKGLSPAAAPFVPCNLRNARPENVTRRTLENVANAAIARRENTSNVHDPSKGMHVTSHREESSSSVLDPSDPAMREIDHEDIEYAARYLYNWPYDQKLYCTTVAEFQEAVKQVREQARRHGCLGGQSKDPAYDAEQDIWWAICDRDPIPLPPAIPDYVTKPRPWNWEDSVFNFRRNGTNSAGQGPEEARKSPRLMGWDPATTERMKHTVDVTRSYYAYKGQIPSVPFRTWAYDSKGHKVAIQSTPDPSAKQENQRCYVESSGVRPRIEAQKPASTPSRALKALSMNEVNERKTRASTSFGALYTRKMNATEGLNAPQVNHRATDSAPPTSTTHDSIGSLGKCDTEPVLKREASKLTRFRHLSQSYQPFVVDAPETPTHREDVMSHASSVTKVDAMRSTLSTIKKSENHCAASGMEKNSTSSPNCHGKYRSSSPSVIDDGTSETMNVSDYSAETKSQWGPEEVFQSSDPRNTSDHLGVSESHSTYAKTAKVNLPAIVNDPSPVSPKGHTHKADPINALM